MEHLPSIYHCQIMIRKLREKLLSLGLGSSQSDKCDSVQDEICHYNDVLAHLEKFSEEENIDRIAQEIAKHHLSHISITLSSIKGPYLVKISVGEIFYTELYTQNEVYHVSSYLNEFYDGYFDSYEVLERYNTAPYLQDIKSGLTARIKHYLPNASVAFNG